MQGALIGLCLLVCAATQAWAQQDGSGSVGGTYVVYKNEETDTPKTVWLKVEPSGPADCEVVLNEKAILTTGAAEGTTEGVVEPGKQLAVKASGTKGSCTWKVLSDERLPAGQGTAGGSGATKVFVYKNGTARAVDLTPTVQRDGQQQPAEPRGLVANEPVRQYVDK